MDLSRERLATPSTDPPGSQGGDQDSSSAEARGQAELYPAAAHWHCSAQRASLNRGASDRLTGLMARVDTVKDTTVPGGWMLLGGWEPRSLELWARVPGYLCLPLPQERGPPSTPESRVGLSMLVATLCPLKPVTDVTWLFFSSIWTESLLLCPAMHNVHGTPCSTKAHTPQRTQATHPI